MKLFLLPFLLLPVLFGCRSSNDPKTITLGCLIEEITDRNSLSQYPEPYYLCKQFSSYDRATVKPNEKSWYANWDRSMFIREENNYARKEYVMMDTESAGAIVRFWMTFAGENAGLGILRIYLDGDSIASIEGKAVDILSGGALVGEPLSLSVSDSTDYKMRGHNLYFPIPYAKRCKVTYESNNIKDPGAKTGGESVYYNINYREYASNTKVVTYSHAELEKYAAQLYATQEKLSSLTVDLPRELSTETLTGHLAIGQVLETKIQRDKQSIRSLKFKIDAKDREQALRSTILEISFDGHTTIESPIGDYFGTGYQIRKSNTWYTKVEDDGTMSCYWVMPYKKECLIRLINKGMQDVKVEVGEILSAPYAWNNNTMYFGASWQQYTRLETGEMKNNEGDGDPFDINYVTLKGKGVYVGDAISLFNTVYAWWGEGDEKIYVDNENFPSHLGTGTEDYYGYAWCRPEKFNNHPFIAQPDGSGNFNPGYTVCVRMRSLDAIPFRESIRVDMEMWHWTKATINFSPITFWYLHPDNINTKISNLEGATEPVVRQRKDLISSIIIDHKIECENMNLEKVTDGNFRYSNNVNKGWSNNMQLIWSDAKIGSKLELSYVSDKEKTIDATVIYTKDNGYRPFQVKINNSNPITINPTASDHSIGRSIVKNIDLKQGENRITITVTSHPIENRKHVGIDCLVLSP